MASLTPTHGPSRPLALRPVDAAVPVGHVYLDVRRRLLYCLDETARRLQNEGLPFTSVDASRQSLTTMGGRLATSADLPLVVAWREGRAAEAAFLLTRKGAVVQHLQWTAAPLCDANGQLVAIVGTLLLRPPEPDWQMLAGLAHDLRNPLQALRLSLDELPEVERLPEELRGPVGRIRRAAERALSVGKDVLDWARGPAQGGRRVESMWFALEPFLSALVEEQATAAQQKGLLLVQDLRGPRAGDSLRPRAPESPADQPARQRHPVHATRPGGVRGGVAPRGR